jgi:two-component system OmpR family response regulator
MKVLVIEDDLATLDYVTYGLEQHGHVVDRATDGRDGLIMGRTPGYDVLVVDRMLPGMDGLSVVKALRGAGIETPTLFLTTVGGIADRVAGLEAGGDDYLVKPFAFSELVARLRALIRRASGKTITTHLCVADLELDRLRRTVARAGRTIDLQPNEFRLLEYLMLNAGQPVTKTMLLENVWRFHFEPGTSIVETQISRLRSKIDRAFDKPLIETVRGGYCLRDRS